MADTEKHTHGEQDALVKEIFELLDARVQANAYADDGSYANQIRTLPRGLRAMAATHHLDVSLTLDDIGWHFLNFGERGLVDETELGLRELVSRLRNSLTISPALDAPGRVAPPRNILDIPASARLARSADRSPT